MASQREAGRQLQQAQQAFDGERAHLQQQVRRSKEEGSVRIQALEDTIRKLGNRSDLHQVGSSSQFYKYPVDWGGEATAFAVSTHILRARPIRTLLCPCRHLCASMACSVICLAYCNTGHPQNCSYVAAAGMVRRVVCYLNLYSLWLSG